MPPPGDYHESVKARDPYLFIPADEFFQQVDQPFGTRQPSSVKLLDEDQLLADGKTPNPVTYRGRIFRFNDDTLLLVQFIRPQVWRIRFSAFNKTGADFTDYNSRTLVQDTLTNLINLLDACEGLKWDVRVVKDPQHYIFQSILNPGTSSEEIGVQLWIQRNPFKIFAVRSVKGLEPAEKPPRPQDQAVTDSVTLKEVDGRSTAIVWQTKERALKYIDNATILSIEKSSTADHLGFGEQGGRSLFKSKTLMNYFNYDNMRYKAIYNKGPYEEREPLYHSEPYFLEVDALPSHRSLIGTLVDNFSHVCIDLAKSSHDTVRIATRFNSFNTIFIAADNVREIITLYTSIIGRPRLKPRFVLGYHQGCYGYDTREKVLDAVQQYRNVKIPLDGMHIDVDIQDNYHTFTIDTRDGHFPDPASMFRTLRTQGVKCSTNITPYISNRKGVLPYSTYDEGLAKNYFVLDDRDIDPSAPQPEDVRYIVYDNPGDRAFLNPNTQRPPYNPPDFYNFRDVYNSKTKPFNGGVWYGDDYGGPGHYPNLNNETVRRWWGEQYKYLVETGLEFVWQDMTQPCMAMWYGDMKSFPFRLLLDSDGWSGDPKAAEKKRAIEIWSLYSYNLHKATYRGLGRLEARKGKRNFIIGRGSFAGSHRYAGLWTGDNSSSWEFLDISVSQVLALGLSGVSIAGADVGGFETINDNWWADPALIIRWYAAYSLLPWFRNHYNGKPGRKHFQEPYAYDQYYQQNKDSIAPDDREIYRAVLPACRWYIRLRYSLLQLLYDAMFENLITGLPIARALIITDEQDRELFTKSTQPFIRSQYLVRNDLLVAPVLPKSPKVQGDKPPGKIENRRVYLPYPDDWYPLNLRPDAQLGEKLATRTSGGNFIDYYCPIRADDDKLPYLTPMYIREGGIIPQIEVRDSVPDPTFKDRKEEPNSITLHIYPGKDNSYDMYLDDGVSRNSAPDGKFITTFGQDPKARKTASNYTAPSTNKEDEEENQLWDSQGQSKFCLVRITQTTVKYADQNDNVRATRSVQIAAPWNGFGGDLSTLYKPTYRIIFWHDPNTNLDSIDTSQIPKTFQPETDRNVFATIVNVPFEKAHTTAGVGLALSHAL